jgi:hypothetical protein
MTNLPLSRAECLEAWEPQPAGNLGTCSGLHRDGFTNIRINDLSRSSNIKIISSFV